MLIISGKLRGPFEIYYLDLKDAHGNGISLPWCTAITLITSLLRYDLRKMNKFLHTFFIISVKDQPIIHI